MGIASARRSKRIVFVSDYQQRTILPFLQVPADRAVRVYLAASPGFDRQTQEQAPAVRERYRLNSPYVFNVSQFYVYQNLVTLVDAFARATSSLPPETLLVLAGPELEPGPAAQVHEAVARAGVTERVRFLGYVPHADLAPLLVGASMFVFPSACESYPSTLVEALASGVPILTTRLGPMPELAGDGARYFDAYSPADLANAISELWSDQKAQRELRGRAVAQAAKFSWDETARQILGVLEQVAD
jgi:glycosyltransferase involved in cell wall biosynthesis